MLISIVVPVYNSSDSLVRLVAEIENALSGHDFEIIFVDDSSQDDSFEVLKELCSSSKKIRAIRLSRNYGQQNALLCGIRHSGGDFVVTMDDDLQHDPAYIKDMLSCIQKGYDCIYAVSKVQKQSLYRKAGSKLTGLFFRAAFNLPKGAKVSSFRMMTRDAASKTGQCTESFVYISAVMLRFTKNILCIETAHRQRVYGSSNYSFKKLFMLFAKLAIYYVDIFPFTLLKSALPDREQYKIESVLGFNTACGDALEKSKSRRVV